MWSLCSLKKRLLGHPVTVSLVESRTGESKSQYLMPKLTVKVTQDASWLISNSPNNIAANTTIEYHNRQSIPMDISRAARQIVV
ncbi:hypothetical protein QQP08_014661 [Theobroma cacao]|nr:hypothetical protein QQP08_014661 [Theobroma cacao]